MESKKPFARFKATYYPEDYMWIITDMESGSQIVYHLNQVETDTILYCAHRFQIIPWNIEWENLDKEQREELLDWFEEKVFPTSTFGKMILSDIYKELT